MMPNSSRKSAPQTATAVSKKFEDFYRQFDHFDETREGKASKLTGQKPAQGILEAKQQNTGQEVFQARFGGLAIIAPYFPVLFRNLGFLDGKSSFKKDKSAQAASLLHYMATGFAPKQPVDECYFSLLLGLDEPVTSVCLEPIHDAFSEADRLLLSVMANWPVSRNLGLSGMRDGFLKRPAKVSEFNANYQLTIQSHPLDVILRSLPWSIGVSFHPWMKKPLMVE